MRRPLPQPKAPATPVLLGAAGLALLLGLLVYLSDRPPGHASLLPAVPGLSGHHLFGSVGGCLPSFVHPFAFSLLTATALPPRPAARDGACLAWALVNLLFEFAQHPLAQAPVAAALHGVLDGAPLARPLLLPLSNYVLHGTFDPADVAAILLGAGAAALLMRQLSTPTR